MLDLDYSEDSTADVDLNVVLDPSGSLVEIQGSAEGRPFTVSELQEMIRVATASVPLVFDLQGRCLEGSE
jgi:ribonuclease PH